MRILIILILSLLGGSPAALPGAEPDYFPLQLGNQWIYREAGLGAGEPVVVDIPKAEVLEGRFYHLVRGFPGGDLWLRMGENGTLFAFDTGARRDRVWVAFATPEGQRYDTEISECNRTAVIDSKRAKFRGPVGEFDQALRIVYPPGNCADAGITDEFYLPYVGLVQRTNTTIAGPRTLELTYARLGGVTVVSAPEVAFTLSLDRAKYAVQSPPAVLTARLTLRYTQSEPIRLTWPSGQRFDLEIRNERGDKVYRWSDGKAFILIFGVEEFVHGEKNFSVEVPLADANSRALPPGKYVAEGWLVTSPKVYAATVGFEIVAAP
jgi:hypothetical protein